MALTVSYAVAQDVRIEAELSSRKIALDSSIKLTITVHGDKNVDPVQLPAIEGFEARYLGPSTRVSIINGQYLSSKSFVYSLLPLKEGKFQIPSIRVTASGKTYTLEPITVEVGGSAGPADPSSQNEPVNFKDKLTVVLKVPKDEVYINEQLPVKILLFVSGLSVRDIQFPDFTTVGYSMDVYEKPQQYQQIINGTRQDIVEFNTKIYPTRTGELQLGPAKIECNVLVKGSPRSSRFGRNSVFDDDFFNSFFDRHEKRPVVLESEATTINVLPLPEEGKPEKFSGAVGQFNFNVAVGPAEVREGDPITLRMTVIGKENLAAVQMPSLPSDIPFKLYDPQIFEKNNIKKSEQVIIPQSDEITEVPAIRFSYFDPQLKKYRTISQGPFPIKVKKLEKGDEFKIVGLEGEFRPAGPETLGQDIVFIKESPGKFWVTGRYIYNSLSLYIVIVLSGILWSAELMHYKRSDRIKTDSVYARRLQAPRQAKQGLAQAKKLIAAGKKEEFYDTVFKTIQQYLGNKLHLSSGAVTFETVQTELDSRNIEQNVIGDIKLIFEECDRVRYASADIDQGRMNASYQRLARGIDHLERHLK